MSEETLICYCGIQCMPRHESFSVVAKEGCTTFLMQLGSRTRRPAFRVAVLMRQTKISTIYSFRRTRFLTNETSSLTLLIGTL